MSKEPQRRANGADQTHTSDGYPEKPPGVRATPWRHANASCERASNDQPPTHPGLQGMGKASAIPMRTRLYSLRISSRHGPTIK